MVKNDYELTPDDEIEIVMDAFRIMFDKDRVHSLFTKLIRKGPTSDLIYVPKGLNGKIVTVIVWDSKNDLAVKKLKTEVEPEQTEIQNQVINE